MGHLRLRLEIVRDRDRLDNRGVEEEKERVCRQTRAPTIYGPSQWGERGHQLLSITNGTLALTLGAVDFFNCSSEGTKDLDLRRAVRVKE